jgi:hypothetical protein
MTGLLFLFYGIKFDLFPTEKTLLQYAWYHHRHLLAVKAGSTTGSYLDDKLTWHEHQLANPDLSWEKRRIFQKFNHSVYDPTLYEEIISFLNTPSFSKFICVGLAEKLRSAVRPGLRVAQTPKDKITTDFKNSPEAVDAGLNAQPVDQSPGAQPVDQSPGAEPADESLIAEPVEQTQFPTLRARTYAIATQLWFECQGKESEYETLSRHLLNFEAFVKEKFGPPQLPGTFAEQKGYSYKTTLKDKNASKKGQLKPCFREIIGNPHIFGEEISARAQIIMDENFT